MASRRVQSVNETPSQLLEDGTQNDDQEVAIQASNFSQLSITEITGADCPSLEAEDESRCPVCLLKMLHPVKLPCQHVFCYLCVKGVAITSSPRCALCRHPIPPQFLLAPNLVQLKPVVNKDDNQVTQQESVPFKQDVVEEQEEQSVQWFYEGRNGWWQYDRRTAQEIENSFRNDDELCKFMVAGLMFTIDFERKLQYRSNDPSKRRNVRRGNTSMQIKGIAGIKTSQLESGEAEPEIEVSIENSNSDERLQPTLDFSQTRSVVMSHLVQHNLVRNNYDSEGTVNAGSIDPIEVENILSRYLNSSSSRQSRGIPVDCDCSLNCSRNNRLPVSTSDVAPHSSQPPSSFSSDPSCFIIPSESTVRHTATQRTSPVSLVPFTSTAPFDTLQTSPSTSTNQRTTSVPSSNCCPSAVPHSTAECSNSDRTVYYDCSDQTELCCLDSLPDPPTPE